MPDPTNPFRAFAPVVPPSDSSEGFSLFAPKQPIDRNQGRTMFERTAAFQGGSQYDNGLVFGQDQYQNRARNQSNWDRVGNALVKTTPAVALGILENAGYLGELISYIDPSQTKDFTNALVEWSIEKRKALDTELPNYLRDREATGLKTLTDSSWWIEHGQGLTESIGEFLATGMGVGGALGKGAKALSSVIGSRLVQAGAMSAAQLGTSATLAYTEGAMSGARIYKEVYDNEITLHGNDALAKQKAATAATKVVQLNTVLNTGLNLTSVSPIFKTMNNINVGTKAGINRLKGETLANYATRLGTLTNREGSIKSSLLAEAFQEGIEEDVNLFAEEEGRIEGGLKEKRGTALDRFIGNTFSSEGVLNFLLGAVGGVGQTVGMNYLPYRNYKNPETGETRRVNNRELIKLSEDEQLKNYVSNLKSDISYLVTSQKNLAKAVEAGDQDAIEKERNNLFNVGALKSIREGTAEEFTQDLQNIAATDNSTVGEDGQTEAMRLGYADNQADNKYKQTAAKKIADIKVLQDEYDRLGTRFEDDFVKSQAFRKRLEVYSSENLYNDLLERGTNHEAYLTKLSTDPSKFDYFKMLAQQKALSIIISEVKNEKALTPLKKEKETLDKLIQERKSLEVDKSYSEAVTENKGVINELTRDYIPLTIAKTELDLNKKDYQDALVNKKAFVEEQLKLKREIIKAQEKALSKKQEVKEKEKEEVEASSASDRNKKVKEEKQAAKKATPNPEPKPIKREKYKDFFITDAGDSIAVTDTDNVPVGKFTTKEEAQAFVDQATPVAAEQVTSSNLKQVFNFNGKTKEQKETEKAILEKEIEANNITDNSSNGFHNKIAYKAQEQDKTTKETIDVTQINPDYLILHSNDFRVGTEVTIKLAKESEWYNEKDPVSDIAIGIYHKDKLVGYLGKATFGGGQIFNIRQSLVALGGEVKTKISAKDIGVVNNSKDRYTTRDVMPNITTFGIGRNNDLQIAPEESIADTVVNKNGFQDGFVYAVLPTPNGLKMAVPLDIKKIDDKVAESIQLAANIFITKDKLQEKETELVNQIFETYGFDLTTSNGLRNYVSSFIYTEPELTDNKRILQINQEVGQDKYYFNVTGTGIQFIKSGAAYKVKGKLIAKELGINTPANAVEGIMDELGSYLKAGAYTKIDLLKLKDNNEFSIPLLSLNEEGELSYTPLIRDTYSDYIKQNTTTNVVGIQIAENEYTYFVQPKIYFDYSFATGDQKTIESVESTKQTAILAPDKSKKLSSVSKSLPKTKIDPTKVTDDDAKDRQKYCI